MSDTFRVNIGNFPMFTLNVSDIHMDYGAQLFIHTLNLSRIYNFGFLITKE